MKEFIAVTDEMLEDHPELYFQLVPYDLRRPCRHIAQEPFELTPADLQQNEFPGRSKQS
jgi:hypothetical protein